MFQILTLVATSSGYRVVSNDYPFMELVPAMDLVQELTADAIDSESDQRYTIVPISWNGRPYKS